MLRSASTIPFMQLGIGYGQRYTETADGRGLVHLIIARFSYGSLNPTDWRSFLTQITCIVSCKPNWFGNLKTFSWPDIFYLDSFSFGRQISTILLLRKALLGLLKRDQNLKF